MNIALDRQMKRWYPLKDHPIQLALVDAVRNGMRFPVVPAGRRSGKTERAKRFIVKEAMQNDNELYFLAAPTRDQVKKIYWDDIKALSLTSIFPRDPSESNLIVYFPNGSEIHLIGLDKPQRIEGVPWTGGVIDEIADIKSVAWQSNILPALNTVTPDRPDYRAWCWLVGVPDGLNHYYDMAQYAENSGDPEWGLFHWKSSEILPKDVIDSAKRQMGKKQYLQEYEASFETASGRIYEDYTSANHTTEEIKPHEQLHWTHDQNYTPLSSAVGVIRPDGVYFLDEIVLTSAVSTQSALEFVDKYKDHKNKHVMLYGDPAGKAGEKHGQESAYTQIESVLKDHGWKWTRRIRRKHPAIKDRQNAVRAKVANASGDVSLYVNTNKAKYCHKGLSTCQLKKGSTFLEEETEYQHITTAIGYMIYWLYPINSKEITSIRSTGV